MRIPRIYDSKMQTQLGSELQLDESGANHVSKVLRLKTGDLIRVFDGRGHEFEATLVQVGKKTVVTLSRELTNNSESPLWVELLQVISRGDRMDFTLQKAVELGVSKIIPLTSERCGVKLDGERAAKKIESYQKLVISACEQCGRAVVPQVAPLHSLDSLLQELQTGSGNTPTTTPDGREFINITLDPRATHKLTSLPPTKAYRLLIGPEGGFSADEVQQTLAAGFTGVTLGPRILRTETTALVTLSILGSHFGDL